MDVPTASGLAEQRLYLVGDDVAYQKAGKLINELRDPIIQVKKGEPRRSPVMGPTGPFYVRDIKQMHASAVLHTRRNLG